MDQTEHAIIVENVSKNFKLPHKRKNSLKSIFTGIFERKNRAKTYEAQHALRDVSFKIEKGEFFGIVGRNGSGKSTLLKMLAGIYQPTKGSVNVKGKLVPFIELGVGFNPELTGRENVYLNGALLGFSEGEVDAMYGEIVSFAELENFMDQKLKNYSSGMQVRLAFSLAVRAEAEILLIDEVLAVGDTDFQRKCFDYFRELKRSDTTVVFVSHDMNAVIEYCDRAVLIDNSKIIDQGEPESIAKQYNKLFSGNETETTETQKKEKRWGDQYATIELCEIDKKSYKGNEDEYINVRVDVKIHKAITHNLSIGFLIKNASGISILGMNTYEMKKTIKEVTQGEKLSVEWRIPNVFGDGKYLLDAAVTSTDGTINHDWIEEIANFRVYRNERSPYLITPNMSVDIKRT